MFDSSELERLAELVRNADIRELTLKQGSARITIRKGPPRAPNSAGTALVPFVEAGGGEARNGSAEDEAESLEIESPFLEEDEEEGEETHWVTSPLVGIFHHVKPLVGLGTRVTQGQIVGVVEAMKLINEIAAEMDGVVIDVLVEDGQAVEYGQPLFLVKADS
ncbi:MAG TPA: biotin/lipoyl-containing protein [Chthonomonadaceae bacterium]|nr:biotin/lipoyl-containing protein [Chthonomonadaceae bacterium]